MGRVLIKLRIRPPDTSHTGGSDNVVALAAWYALANLHVLIELQPPIDSIDTRVLPSIPASDRLTLTP
jgi:hypothetical protein